MVIVLDKKAISDKLEELNQKSASFTFPRWADFPSVGLYMDQVTELINGYLSRIPAFSDDNSMITASMINNYVKSEIMPAPEKKRYSKEHLAYILIICTLKQTFNIALISQILNKNFDKNEIEKQYDMYAADFESSCKKALANTAEELKTNSGILNFMSQISAKKSIAEILIECIE